MKDFLLPEFRTEVEPYHVRVIEAYDQLHSDPSHIDWFRVERLLTHDLRLTPDPYLVLGRASEYRFYSLSADYRGRIFFTMDVRDLGVDLVLTYEQANDWIQFHRSIGVDLMFLARRSSRRCRPGVPASSSARLWMMWAVRRSCGSYRRG